MKSKQPTVAVFFHWVAGIQSSYALLTNSSKSRRMAGFHSFYQALMCTYTMTENSPRGRQTNVWELSWKEIALSGPAIYFHQWICDVRQIWQQDCFSGRHSAFPLLLKQQLETLTDSPPIKLFFTQDKEVRLILRDFVVFVGEDSNRYCPYFEVLIPLHVCSFISSCTETYWCNVQMLKGKDICWG